MRRLRRIDLPTRALDALAAYQRTLDRQVAAERRKKRPRTQPVIEAAWTARRQNRALKTADLALDAMASGLGRCMYCEDSRGCNIEHHRPKARHPALAFRWPNLLKVCTDCNTQKGDAFHRDLLDPTRDDPFDHVRLSLTTGRYEAREDSRRGRATLRILPRLRDDPRLTRGRAHAWVKLRRLLVDYDDDLGAGRTADAAAIRDVVVNEPFSAVFAAMLRAATEPGAAIVLGENLLRLVRRRVELPRWLDDADHARAVAAAPLLLEEARTLRIRT